MIVINDKFAIEKDTASWRLYYTYEGKDVDGQNKKRVKSTWHANFKQAANAIINLDIGESETFKDLISKLEKSSILLEQHLTEKVV